MLNKSRQVGALAELLVAYRFLEAGRLVAWPIVPCAYNLLVDGGNRCFRMQVKRAQAKDERTGAIRYEVRLTKRRAGGDRPIRCVDVDYVCVVCRPDWVYVLPTADCRSPTDPTILTARLSIGSKSGGRFVGFLNRFTIGDGTTTETHAQAEIIAVRPGSNLPRGWPLKSQLRGSARKPHHHLSHEEVATLLASAQSGTPLVSLAQQFDVTTTTVMNLLRGKRKDLRQP